VARFSLLSRIRRRAERGPKAAPQRALRRAPSPGALRRERRAILKAREERIRDLGGLTLEMYRRSNFRDELVIEQCREIVALEERVQELDSMLSAVATARRAPSTCECGAPVPWGSHFCANCGRPTGGDPVITCKGCGHPLPADASFCASCGRAADLAEDEEQAAKSETALPAPDVAAVHAPTGEEEPSEQPAADPWER
jgi:Double zinc ribbon